MVVLGRMGSDISILINNKIVKCQSFLQLAALSVALFRALKLTARYAVIIEMRMVCSGCWCIMLLL